MPSRCKYLVTFHERRGNEHRDKCLDVRASPPVLFSFPPGLILEKKKKGKEKVEERLIISSPSFSRVVEPQRRGENRYTLTLDEFLDCHVQCFGINSRIKGRFIIWLTIGAIFGKEDRKMNNQERYPII